MDAAGTVPVHTEAVVVDGGGAKETPHQLAEVHRVVGCADGHGDAGRAAQEQLGEEERLGCGLEARVGAGAVVLWVQR